MIDTITFEGQFLIQLMMKGRQNECTAFLALATKLLLDGRRNLQNSVETVASLKRQVFTFDGQMNVKYNRLSIKKCLLLIPVLFVEGYLCEEDLSELADPQKQAVMTMVLEHQEKISHPNRVEEKNIASPKVNFQINISRRGLKYREDK